MLADHMGGERELRHKFMRHVDNAHLNLSAGRPPFHTPGKMIVLISINRTKVEKGNDHEKGEANRSLSKKKKSISGYGRDSSWNKVLDKRLMKHLLDSLCKHAR